MSLLFPIGSGSELPFWASISGSTMSICTYLDRGGESKYIVFLYGGMCSCFEWNDFHRGIPYSWQFSRSSLKLAKKIDRDVEEASSFKLQSLNPECWLGIFTCFNVKQRQPNFIICKLGPSDFPSRRNSKEYLLFSEEFSQYTAIKQAGYICEGNSLVSSFLGAEPLHSWIQ